MKVVLSKEKSRYVSSNYCERNIFSSGQGKGNMLSIGSQRKDCENALIFVDFLLWYVTYNLTLQEDRSVQTVLRHDHDVQPILGG